VNLAARLGDRAPTLRCLLQAGLLSAARDAAGAAPDLALNAVTFAPVIPDPDKIICIGLNYRDHVDETGRTETEKPALLALRGEPSRARAASGAAASLRELRS
jgi:2-keto-4-pentenoate hydratase/2-oxohepta-3-ene-1,7-dioic acid hydratase in catechol pathway